MPLPQLSLYCVAFFGRCVWKSASRWSFHRLVHLQTSSPFTFTFSLFFFYLVPRPHYWKFNWILTNLIEITQILTHHNNIASIFHILLQSQMMLIRYYNNFWWGLSDFLTWFCAIKLYDTAGWAADSNKSSVTARMAPKAQIPARLQNQRGANIGQALLETRIKRLLMIWGPRNHCPFYHEMPVRLLLLWDTSCAFRVLSCLLFTLCSPMHFSQGFIYKCLLADQTAPRSYSGVQLMLGAQGEKERKREAIILPVRRRFLLLFHPLEAQEVHPQTIWYLEIRCESWGNARAQQYPRGPGGPSPRLLSPTFRGTVFFTSFRIALRPVCLLPGLQHLCCITVQKTIPTLRQANCISFVSLAQLQKSHWN